MSLKYRPEIDGLRAIAVLAVLFYHIEFIVLGHDFMPGGFLGVDIFFVISGYLITSIILKDLLGSGFSFARFYERRARRILPALLTVIATTLPVAWSLLLPKALIEYSKSILWALGFSANFYFWQEDSYTAEPSALKPFLHTWSLSIEEQFYFVFPILLILIIRYRKQYLGLFLIILSAISFSLSEALSSQYVDSSFYLLHTRAWELLAGSLMAHYEQKWGGRLSKDSWSSTLSWLGIGLLLLPMFWLKDTMPHPSHMTLPAIIGSCLVIWFSQPHSLTSAILGHRWMRSIGLISYSLYLWHFPIIAFARIQMGELSFFQKWLALVLSFILAITSYFFIETPFRNSMRVSNKLFIKTLCGILLILVILLSFFVGSDGAPNRFREMAQVLNSAKKVPVSQNNRDCHARPLHEMCEFRSPETEVTILNIGDSHADVMGPALLKIARELQVNYVHMTTSGCPYVEGAYTFDNAQLDPECTPLFQQSWKNKILSYPNPIIFYSARLPLYLSGQRFNNQLGGIEDGDPFHLSLSPTNISPNDQIEKAVLSTLTHLKSHSRGLFIIYPIPEVGWHVPRWVKSQLQYFPMSQWTQQFQSLEVKTKRITYDHRSHRAFQILNQIVGPKVQAIHPSQTLCDAHFCYAKDSQTLFYRDDDHITATKAEEILTPFLPLLKKLSKL